MTTHSVVEDFDVFSDRRCGFRTGSEVAVIDKLLLEVPPETLRRRVVVTVAFSGHRGDQPCFFDV